MINFVGFQKMVEALGGVDMCIDERVESVHYARSGKYMGEDIYQGPGYVYTPGCRHLQPWEALDYVRQRENLPHGDYDRQRHQQQFIMAMFKQLASAGTLTDITKFSALKDALGQLLTLDLNGDVVDWIFSFKGLRPSDVTMIQTNGGNYSSKNVNGKSYRGPERRQQPPDGRAQGGPGRYLHRRAPDLGGQHGRADRTGNHIPGAQVTPGRDPTSSIGTWICDNGRRSRRKDICPSAASVFGPFLSHPGGSVRRLFTAAVLVTGLALTVTACSSSAPAAAPPTDAIQLVAKSADSINSLQSHQTMTTTTAVGDLTVEGDNDPATRTSSVTVSGPAVSEVRTIGNDAWVAVTDEAKPWAHLDVSKLPEGSSTRSTLDVKANYSILYGVTSATQTSPGTFECVADLNKAKAAMTSDGRAVQRAGPDRPGRAGRDQDAVQGRPGRTAPARAAQLRRHLRQGRQAHLQGRGQQLRQGDHGRQAPGRGHHGGHRRHVRPVLRALAAGPSTRPRALRWARGGSGHGIAVYARYWRVLTGTGSNTTTTARGGRA